MIGEGEGEKVEYVIALLGARTVVGKRCGLHPASPVLSPAYEMSIQVAQTRNGLQIQRTLLPLLCYGTPLVLRLPPDTLCINVADLSSKERADLMTGMENAEKIRLSIRAAESGLSLSGGIPRG